MLRKINRRISSFLSNKYPNWDISVALRYLGIAGDIKKNFPSGAKLLDVGSGEFGLATYIGKGYEITGTDIDPGEKRQKGFHIVQASAESLPFEDEFFDCVVSVDMMEHLPLNIRGEAVSEMLRVAKSRVYISFPRGGLSKKIDSLISKYYKFTHKEDSQYLNEHQKHGLPKEGSVDNFILDGLRKYKKRAKVEKKGNANVLIWLGLLLLGFSEVKILTNLYHKLLLLLPVLNIMHFWPTYRVSYKISLAGNG